MTENKKAYLNASNIRHTMRILYIIIEIKQKLPSLIMIYQGRESSRGATLFGKSHLNI